MIYQTGVTLSYQPADLARRGTGSQPPLRLVNARMDTLKSYSVPPTDKECFAVKLQKRLALSRIPALDGLRAIAVFLVVFYHFNVLLSPASLGLMMFFVLSGFLITWLLLRENDKQGAISLRGFYRRRTLRIFPAFYVYWVGTVLLLLLTGREVLWPQAVSSFFYAANYYNAINGDPGTAFSHTWSLAIEEQFYILWPVVFIRLRNDLSKMTRFLCCTILAVWLHRLVLCFVFEVDQGYFYSAFDTRLDQLMVGCLLAVALRRGVMTSFWKAACSNLLLPLGVCLLLLSSIYFGDILTPRYRDVFGFALEPILIAVLIVQVIWLSSLPLMKWIEWPALRYLGRISYSLYLYQQVTVSLVRNIMEGQSEMLQLIIAVAVTVIAAALSYHLIERPFLRLKSFKLAPAG